MTIENKLVRRNEGTIASPASVQTKQMKFDVGDSGGSDRTQLVYKDSATTEHVFITEDEIDDKISDSISSSTSTSPYTVVSTISELENAMESAAVLDIMIISDITVTSSQTFSVTSSKRVFETNKGSLKMRSGSQWIYTAFPTSGSTAIDIQYHIFVDLDTPANYSFSPTGGFVSNPGYTMKVKGIPGGFSPVNGATEVTYLYEQNTGSTAIGSGCDFELWTGATHGKTDVDTVYNPTAKQVISRKENADGLGQLNEVVEETTISTTGIPRNTRSYLEDGNIVGQMDFNGTEDGRGQVYHRFKGLLQNAGLVDLAYLFGAQYTRGVSLRTAPEDWDPEDSATFIQVGPELIVYDRSTGGNGVGYVFNGYIKDISPDVWAFRKAGDYAYRREIDSSGRVKEYRSNGVAAAVDDPITWNEIATNTAREYDINSIFDGSSTAAADPGTSKVRLNNFNVLSVTQIYINNTDSNLFDRSATWANSNSVISSITIRDRQYWAKYTVSSRVTNSGWTQLNVTYVNSAGGTSIPNLNPVCISFEG